MKMVMQNYLLMKSGSHYKIKTISEHYRLPTNCWAAVFVFFFKFT